MEILARFAHLVDLALHFREEQIRFSHRRCTDPDAFEVSLNGGEDSELSFERDPPVEQRRSERRDLFDLLLRDRAAAMTRYGIAVHTIDAGTPLTKHFDCGCRHGAVALQFEGRTPESPKAECVTQIAVRSAETRQLFVSKWRGPLHGIRTHLNRVTWRAPRRSHPACSAFGSPAL